MRIGKTEWDACSSDLEMFLGTIQSDPPQPPGVWTGHTFGKNMRFATSWRRRSVVEKKSHTMCFHSQYFGVRSLHCAACWKKQRLGDETQLWAAYLDYAFPTQRYAASHLWRWWWWKLRCLSRLDGVSCAGYETLVRWGAFGARQQAVLLCCAQHHGRLAMDVEGRLPCTDLPQRS